LNKPHGTKDLDVLRSWSIKELGLQKALVIHSGEKLYFSFYINCLGDTLRLDKKNAEADSFNVVSSWTRALPV